MSDLVYVTMRVFKLKEGESPTPAQLRAVNAMDFLMRYGANPHKQQEATMPDFEHIWDDKPGIAHRCLDCGEIVRGGLQNLQLHVCKPKEQAANAPTNPTPASNPPTEDHSAPDPDQQV